MTKLTQKHREHIANLIWQDITEYQTDDRYYFDKENITIIWVPAEEHYLILDDATRKFTWESAFDLESTIENFSDATLIEWYCSENSCSLEDLEEYIEDEIEDEIDE